MKKHVLLCSHNGENFIKDQILSIINQEEKIDYIHIFDFASTDTTYDQIIEIKETHKNYAWNISKINHAPGPAASFFYAIKKVSPLISSTDFILLADQDDVWLKNKVSSVQQVFLKRIKNSPDNKLLIFHNVAITDEKLNIIQDTFYTGNPYSIPRDLSPDRLLLCNPIIGHTMVLSGALLQLAAKKLQGENYLMHDWAISLLASRTGEIVYTGNIPLSLYRQHNANILGAARKRKFTEKFYRTYFFSKKIIAQNQEFGKLLPKIQGQIIHPKKLDVFLEKINKKYLYWLIYPTLITLAIFRGPTIQRKLLSLFILLQWIM